MSALPKPEIRVLKARPATAAALAPYGQLLGYNPDVEPMPIDFYAGAVKVRRVVDCVMDDQLELPVVTVNPRPLELRWMERHTRHTQGFIPLGGKPFVAVFAPPNDQDIPDLDQVEAFHFDGQAGFMMKLGTWHDFPYALEENTHLIVLLRREATDGLVRDNVIQNEVIGPDLEKKDIVQRTQVLFRVEL
ncbi:MAG: ureidoglycolate lyase [Chromatiales bacterium]|nr:ureidoglycolate lyase [Chromatiales bacterium]